MWTDLERLLRQMTVLTLALAVALGWSLFQVAKGPADLVTGLATHYQTGDSLFRPRLQPFTWVIDGRVLTLDSLIAGAVELAFVLLVAALLVRRGFVGR